MSSTSIRKQPKMHSIVADLKGATDIDYLAPADGWARNRILKRNTYPEHQPGEEAPENGTILQSLESTMSSAKTYRLYSSAKGITSYSRYYRHGDPVLDVRAYSVEQAYFLAQQHLYSSDGSAVGISQVR